MNSEIFGKATDVPWAFIFERVDMLPRHPGQLYEAIACIIPILPKPCPSGDFFLFFLGTFRNNAYICNGKMCNLKNEMLCVPLHYHTTRITPLHVASWRRYWLRVCSLKRLSMILSLHKSQFKLIVRRERPSYITPRRACRT